ncbi:hypothetical protein LINPERHAP2_LOCUS25670 [Linum perenne]
MDASQKFCKSFQRSYSTIGYERQTVPHRLEIAMLRAASFLDYKRQRMHRRISSGNSEIRSLPSAIDDELLESREEASVFCLQSVLGLNINRVESLNTNVLDKFGLGLHNWAQFGKPWIRVSFVPQSLNKVADWVAVSARQGSQPNDWFLSLISFDCNFSVILVTVEW